MSFPAPDNFGELAFRRICAGANALNQRLPFELVMIPKASNSTGLHIADLVARSVGIKVLRPAQPNRAYDIVAKKFRVDADRLDCRTLTWLFLARRRR